MRGVAHVADTRGLLEGAAAERGDVLAYLERKLANSRTVERRSAEFAEQGRWTARLLEVLADDIRAGLHVGEAAVAGEQDK